MRRLALVMILAACSRSAPEPTGSSTTSNAPAATTSHAVATADPTPPLDFLPPNAEPWNPKQIDWQPYAEGLALAKKQNKNVVLVFFTTWCAHCKNYSKVFSDPRLVMRSKEFVMIRLDADANESISNQYKPDGTYVPRTFILDSSGKIDSAGDSSHPRYKHFFDEMHADSLIEAMDNVLDKPR